MKNIGFFGGNAIKIEGITDYYVRFVEENQLMDPKRWEALVKPFVTREDSSDAFWRGEFFGKEMRGASLVYTYTRDERLYEVLCGAVEKLLAAQDEYGRISTYDVEHEFCGWDMWCRKYVLTGLQHFYRICKDEAFKKRIIEALKRHTDYIISKIGAEDGKKNITETSSWWGCVNSCTILEPVVELYKQTGEKRYLDFAKYIISTGGSSDCDFMRLALENKLFPYQYPVVKAYETMSYFEGLLAYYEVCGEQKYLTAVQNFIEAVYESDLTVIGCCGCTHELFDNSSVRQTEYSDQIMQETCVTVTLMRLSLRLYFLSGDTKYMDVIERSGFNALYGSVNTSHEDIYNLFMKKYVSGMTFDSYSPLYMNSRWRGTGGYLEFNDGDSCGCCDAIGACGVAIMPLVAAMKCDEGIIVNYLFRGSLSAEDVNGKKVVLDFDSDYPTTENGTVTVKCDGTANLKLFIRCPGFYKQTAINGVSVKGGGYYTVEGEFKSGDKIEISYVRELKVLRLNGKTAFLFGSLTLAADELKGDLKTCGAAAVADVPPYKTLPVKDGELVRVEIEKPDGTALTLTDYRSCGKNRHGKTDVITVWFD